MLLEREYEKISPKALKCWQINGAIFSLFITAAVLVVFFIWFKQWYIIPIIPVTIVLSCFVFPFIEYKQWKYLIDKDRVEIVHGIFIIKRNVIPINRIQHLKVGQGFIQKFFDISDVTIYTAAGIEKIEAVPTKDSILILERLNSIIVTEDGGQNV